MDKQAEEAKAAADAAKADAAAADKASADKEASETKKAEAAPAGGDGFMPAELMFGQGKKLVKTIHMDGQDVAVQELEGEDDPQAVEYQMVQYEPEFVQVSNQEKLERLMSEI